MEYKIEIVKEEKEGEEMIEKEGEKVLIEKEEVIFIMGKKMDFEVKKMRKGFVLKKKKKK